MPHKDPEKRKAWRKEYRQKNKLEIRQKEKEYYHNIHKHKSFIKEQQAAHRRTLENRFVRAKAKCRRKNIEWSLSLHDYECEIKLPCVYCDNRLGKPSEVGVGLDRKDPAKGYTKENSVSCCYTCNRIKGDELSIDETIVAVTAILKLRMEREDGSN